MLERFMERTTTSLGLLALRVTAGLGMLLLHGWDKLMTFNEKAEGWLDPLGIGSQLSLGLTVFAEVACAALVVLGFFTRTAALPLVIAMGVAAYFHLGIKGDPLKATEPALLYLTMFAVILISGPGKLSVDGLWWSKKNK